MTTRLDCSTRHPWLPAAWPLLACFLAPLVAGCAQEAATPAADPTPAVTVVEVTTGTVPITMQFSGTAQAVKVVNITPRVTGYVNERYFTEGETVKKGDPLYLIDPRPFEDQVNELTANLETQQADLTFWEKEVTRFTNLVKENAGSQQQLDSAVDKRDEAKAQVKSFEAQLADAQLNLSFTRINAPLDGRMQQTQINIGNLVTQNKDVLTTLVTLDPIYVIFNMTRDQAYQIQQLNAEGYKDTLVRPLDNVIARFYLPDGKMYGKSGKIDFVSAQIDTTTDSLTVRAVVANTDTPPYGVVLIPGQYVPVELILGERSDALLIPQSAVVQSQIGSQVFVVNDQNKVEARTVELGDTYQDLWVVEKGLKVGERVVSEGNQKVKSGMSVKPHPAPKITVPPAETKPAADNDSSTKKAAADASAADAPATEASPAAEPTSQPTTETRAAESPAANE